MKLVLFYWFIGSLGHDIVLRIMLPFITILYSSLQSSIWQALMYVLAILLIWRISLAFLSTTLLNDVRLVVLQVLWVLQSSDVMPDFRVTLVLDVLVQWRLWL